MKNFFAKIYVLGIALLVSGCGGGEEEFAPRDLQFTRVVNAVSRYWPVGTYVFKAEADWSIAWAQYVEPYYTARNELPVKPTIDFLSSMLVGLSIDSSIPVEPRVRMSLLGLAITRVVEEAALVRVEYEYIYPMPGVSYPPSSFSGLPIPDFIQIAATSKPITFVRTGAMEPPPGIK
ncbi:MAG: hypothetical protein KBD82_19520 [Rhodoferax sp.]|uniref:hypothetical protein n=1 Tax=Rhodoferax sp. TaxID=50421 RepID=UPI001B5F9590|nr:hypothetical protein [Rhodoferax sp.]MBP9061228.1 hypothetical protein [Rhodoferax sp.]MBP9737824.1 hypothetical protein [Rhodoferax sp.]